MKPHPFDIAPSFGDFFKKEAERANKSKISTVRLEKRRASGKVVKVPLVGKKPKQ